MLDFARGLLHRARLNQQRREMQCRRQFGWSSSFSLVLRSAG